MGAKKKSGKVTIHDVAQAAGVSVMTVSRSMRGIDGVSEETRAKVVAIAREMNYMPNFNASALVGAESKLIGISIPTLFNQVFADMLMGMRRTFDQAGYASVIDTTDYDRTRERQFLERLLAWRPAAVILTGIQQDAETMKLLRDRDVTCLQIWDLTDDPIDLCVGIDHRKCGVLLGRYLAGLGYRRPAFIGRPAGGDTRADARFAGLAYAFSQAGSADLRRIEVRGDNDFTTGAQGYQSIDARDHPDVICCLNDHLAVGAMLAAEAAGHAVPESFGLAGFNGLAINQVLKRQLTTVETPRREIGLVAARNLLAKLNGVTPSPVTVLPCRLVEGETTRPVG
ncbi:MAG: LacI family DNA-binding transcriptional regulator [Pseudomonadota bacterium]